MSGEQHLASPTLRKEIGAAVCLNPKPKGFRPPRVPCNRQLVQALPIRPPNLTSAADLREKGAFSDETIARVHPLRFWKSEAEENSFVVCRVRAPRAGCGAGFEFGTRRLLRADARLHCPGWTSLGRQEPARFHPGRLGAVLELDNPPPNCHTPSPQHIAQCT